MLLNPVPLKSRLVLALSLTLSSLVCADPCTPVGQIVCTELSCPKTSFRSPPAQDRDSFCCCGAFSWKGQARKMSEGRITPAQQQQVRRLPAQSSLFQDFFQLGQPAPPPDELPVGRDLQKPFCLLLFVVMFFAGYYAYLIWPPVLYLPSSFSDLPDYYPQSRIVR